MKHLRDAAKEALAGTALVRLDLNTEDEWRLDASLPTLEFLKEYASKVVIVSHKGRPEHKEKELSLEPYAAIIQKKIGSPVAFIPHFDFAKIRETIDSSPEVKIFLLENLRFLPGENENDSALGKDLASLGTYFVNDAFAVSHRENASVVAIADFLPSYAGLEFEREIENLQSATKTEKRPFVVILGGGKAEDKLGVVQNLHADTFLLGGAPANAVLSMRGLDIRDSAGANLALPGLENLAHNPSIITPVDFKTSDGKIFDIGDKAINNYKEVIRDAATIIWNGPMGLIEDPRFETGTLEIAKAVAENRGAFKVAGGGETVMFLKKYDLDQAFSFISTGGGAMLDFLAGKELPGIKALETNE